MRLEQLLLRLGLGNNRLQFLFLRVEVILALVETLTRAIEALSLLLSLSLTLADALLTKLNLECLILNLFGERFELAVVPHVVLLLGVLLNQRLAVLDLHLVSQNALVHLVVVVFHALEARTKSFQLVLEVTHFQRKFSADHAKAIDAGVNDLEVIEGSEFVLGSACFLLGHAGRSQSWFQR